VKAKYLIPGTEFKVDPPDPESPTRICLTNNPEQGLRFGFPNNSKYWCFMGEEVEVEVIPKVTKED
jgi:hypothetical protein